MLDIAVSAFCAASYARRCATDKPSGNGDLRNPGDTEHTPDTACHCENVELDAKNNIVVELPGKLPIWRIDDAVSSNISPTAYCELEWVES